MSLVQLYDGRLTASLVLKDIRPGDILEYAYTRQGRNPVLDGHVHDYYRLQFGRPMAWLKRRVIWDPAVRSLGHKVIGGRAEPQEIEGAGGLRELRWSARDVPRLRTESSTPVWFEATPWLEISDFASWEEVSAWARSQYPPGELPAELRGVCEDLKRSARSDEEAVVAALRWVKSNVRYLGSFFGEHTYKPYPLEKVLERRFGDCKDKGSLLAAMLRHMGFDAAPALVNTDSRHEVRNNLPGPAAFDHVIVHLRLHGEDYWLDGTATFSRGPLRKLYTPAYGSALAIRPESKALSPVAPRGFEVDRIEMHETLDVPDMSGTMELRVVTIATGAEADALRRAFATDSREETQDDYREFYEADYPKIETASEVRIEDDEEANRITVHEHYAVEEFWVPEEGNGEVVEASIYARYLAGDLNRPVNGERESPFAIQHPCNVRQTITVNLPEAWSAVPSREEIKSDVFEFSVKSEIAKGNRQIKYTFDYRTLADHVAADGFEAYRDAYDKLVDELSYSLSYEDEDEEEFEAAETEDEDLAGWTVMLVFLGLAGFAGGIALAAGLYFWDPVPRAPMPTGPTGIGGWLVLPMLGIVVSPLAILLGPLTRVPVFDGEVKETLLGDQAESWLALYAWEWLGDFFLLPLAIVLLVLFFQKRSSVPTIFIMVAVLFLVADAVSYGLGVVLFEPGEIIQDEVALGLAQSAAGLVLWGSYMWVSRRVKNTFRVTRRRRVPPPLPPVLSG